MIETSTASGSGKSRSAVRLTHRYVVALQAEAEPYRVPDRGCAGLAVRVAPSGVKTWDLTYRIRGMNKVRRLSLGKVTDLSLEQARDRANRLTSAARQGHDLLAEGAAASAEAAARIKVKELIDRYMKRRVRGRCRTAATIESRLNKTLEPVLEKAAADIRRRDLRELLDEKADEGFLREAEQRRITIATMFRWAVGQDYIESDPAAGLTSYGRATPRERVLDDAEIQTLWPWLETSDLPEHYGEILKLQLLIGARCGEIGGLVASEIDPSTWLWTLPAERSKNNRPRVTPLVGWARDIVEARLKLVPRGLFYMTYGGKPIKATHLGNALNSRVRPMPIAKFTTHDLRRTVVTRLAELGVPLDTVAAVAGHDSGSARVRGLMRHYVHTDFVEAKAAALTQWDAQLRTLIGDKTLPSPWVSPVPIAAE